MPRYQATATTPRGLVVNRRDTTMQRYQATATTPRGLVVFETYLHADDLQHATAKVSLNLVNHPQATAVVVVLSPKL